MIQSKACLGKFKNRFKEGIYTDGNTIIEAWFSHEKEAINFTNSGKGHTSVYPIVWIVVLKNNFTYIGKV